MQIREIRSDKRHQKLASKKTFTPLKREKEA
jgi:hypothetical protein